MTHPAASGGSDIVGYGAMSDCRGRADLAEDASPGRRSRISRHSTFRQSRCGRTFTEDAAAEVRRGVFRNETTVNCCVTRVCTPYSTTVIGRVAGNGTTLSDHEG